MTYTEKELFSQYDALEQTFQEIKKSEEQIVSFFNNGDYKRILFVGCGSSYSVAKSAMVAANLRLDIPAFAFAAGDLLVNFEQFVPILKDAMIVSISRSGSTSEVLRLCEMADKELGVPTLSLCAKCETPLAKVAKLNMEFPWAFDESVCQTRTVSNLYLACLMLIGTVSKDDKLLSSLQAVIEKGNDYIADNKDALEQIAKKEWTKVVVLADGELEGIAEEGSLAFTEIPLIPSSYFHLLDVRHGPMVLIDNKTLVIAALSPGSDKLQYDLLAHLKKNGATVVAFSDRKEELPHVDCAIFASPQPAFAAQGLPFVFIPQALAFYKAIHNGVNPDQPEGLDPWIQL